MYSISLFRLSQPPTPIHPREATGFRDSIPQSSLSSPPCRNSKPKPHTSDPEPRTQLLCSRGYPYVPVREFQSTKRLCYMCSHHGKGKPSRQIALRESILCWSTHPSRGDTSRSGRRECASSPAKPQSVQTNDKYPATSKPPKYSAESASGLSILAPKARPWRARSLSGTGGNQPETPRKNNQKSRPAGLD